MKNFFKSRTVQAAIVTGTVSIIILIATRLYPDTNAGSIEVKNFSGSINTIGQTGGVNIVNNDSPETIIFASPRSLNIDANVGYRQVYDLCISNFNLKNNILVSTQTVMIGQPIMDQNKRGFAIDPQKGLCELIQISFITTDPINKDATFSVIKN
jgi:hypothetical protein